MRQEVHLGAGKGQNKTGLSLEFFRTEARAWERRQEAVTGLHKVAPTLRNKTGPKEENRGSQTVRNSCVPMHHSYLGPGLVLGFRTDLSLQVGSRGGAQVAQSEAGDRQVTTEHKTDLDRQILGTGLKAQSCL